MNKTHIVKEHACGCVERKWLFGRDWLRECLAHAVERRRRERERPSHWGGPTERTEDERATVSASDLIADCRDVISYLGGSVSTEEKKPSS